MLPKTAAFLLIVFILAGCGGGGDSTMPVENDTPLESVSHHTQALLGPVVNAAVEIYDATDLAAGLLCSGVTSDAADLDQAGFIEIPQDCVTEQGLYLLVVSGGSDIDTDDDGIIDPSPTQVKGAFHALITGSQIAAGNAKATALTDAAYQHVRYLLAAGSSQNDILQALDFSAVRLLKRDLNSDGTIDHLDLAIWHPRLDRDSFRPSLERLDELTKDIHMDSSTAMHALRLHSAVSPRIGRITGLSDADRLLRNGPYLYVASSQGLQVADISDPDAVRILSSYPAVDLERASRMVIEGEILYIERKSDSTVAIDVLAFDLSDPANPVLLNREPFVPGGFDINKYLRHGDYAYVAMHRVVNPNDFENIYHEFRLDVIDLSVAGSPQMISSVALDTYCSELVIQGDRLYVGTELGPYLQSGGLSVYDISNPSAPGLINRLELVSLEALTVIDGFAYGLSAAEASGGAHQVVSVFSLDPDSGAELIGSLETQYEVWYRKQLLMESGDRGYLATPDGVAVIDFTDRTKPTVVDQLTTNGSTGGMALSGIALFAAVDGYGLQSFDVSGISSITSPAIIDTIEIGNVLRFARSDNARLFAYSYVQDSSSRLFRLDLTDSRSPIISATGQLPDSYDDLTMIDSNTLYASSMYSGLNLFDVSGQNAIEFLSTYNNPDAYYTSSFASENGVGVLSGIPDFLGQVPDWYLLTLDLSQPTDPVMMNRVTVGYQPSHIAIDGGLVFVSTFRELVVYRLVASGGLSWQGALAFTGDTSPSKLIPKGSYAFLSYGTNTLGILDISNPESPSQIFTIETPGQVADMTLSGDLLFIACNAGGLQVVDVADPRSPRFIGNLPTSAPAETVAVVDERVYVATADNIVVTRLPVIGVP